MSYAVITIDNIDKSESNYMHFKDKSQKAWNCNVPELIANFTAGERYFIDYAETPPKEGRKYGSKYINRARHWKEEDGPNTWPDKEPYTGGSSYKSGGGKMKNDYDPEIGKHQTAANCAMSWCAQNVKTMDELVLVFPVVAAEVLKFVDSKSVDTGPMAAGSGDNTPSNPDDEFGF